MKCLIWDFDGTLGYRDGGMYTPILVELLNQELPAAGITPEQVRPHLQSGYPWHTPERSHTHIVSADQWWEEVFPVFRRAMEAFGVGVRRAEEMARQVRPIYADPTRWRLYDDALPTLQQLSRQGWTHVVLSNHVPELPAFIRHVGLDRHVERVFNSADTGYEKPDPRAFACVLEAMGAGSVRWMIGDSMAADVAGAEALGIPGILVRKFDAGAKRYCEDLRAVPAIVNNGSAGT